MEFIPRTDSTQIRLMEKPIKKEKLKILSSRRAHSRKPKNPIEDQRFAYGVENISNIQVPFTGRQNLYQTQGRGHLEKN